jgi:hypothetical protein
MPVKTHYTATFADGTTITRKSVRNNYTYAWRATGTRKNGSAADAHGYSSTIQRANIEGERIAKWFTNGKYEVVPVVIVEKTKATKIVRKTTAKPFRIQRKHALWLGATAFVVENTGRKHLRFATRGEAQTRVDLLNEESVNSGSGYRYIVV